MDVTVKSLSVGREEVCFLGLCPASSTTGFSKHRIDVGDVSRVQKIDDVIKEGHTLDLWNGGRKRE